MPLIYFIAVAVILFLALRLSCGACVMGRGIAGGVRMIPVIPLGWTLSLFLAITYLACLAFDILFPGYAIYKSWAGLLPGFVWLTPAGFAIGLVESFLYGWYAALVFGGLHNALVARRRLA